MARLFCVETVSRYLRCAVQSRAMAVLCFLAVAAHTTVACAQTFDEEGYYRRGADLREAGHDSEALGVFREILEQRPSGRARAQVALAEQALGQWLAADGHLRAALADREDPWVRRYRSVLEGALAVIGRHVGAIAFSGEPAGARVTVDGAPAGMLPLSEPVRVLAGEVTVEVTAPGRYPLTRRVSVRAGETVREAVMLRVLSTQTVPGGEREREGERVVVREVMVATRAQRVLAWVTAGTAAVFLGTSAVAWVLREDAVQRWNDDTRCLGHGRSREQNCGDDRDAAESATVVAVSAAVGAGVLGVVSAVLFATMHGRAEPARAMVQCSPGVGGASCVVRF